MRKRKVGEGQLSRDRFGKLIQQEFSMSSSESSKTIVDISKDDFSKNSLKKKEYVEPKGVDEQNKFICGNIEKNKRILYQKNSENDIKEKFDILDVSGLSCKELLDENFDQNEENSKIEKGKSSEKEIKTQAFDFSKLPSASDNAFLQKQMSQKRFLIENGDFDFDKLFHLEGETAPTKKKAAVQKRTTVPWVPEKILKKRFCMGVYGIREKSDPFDE